MHESNFREISKNEIRSISKEMKDKGNTIVAITSYLDDEKKPVITYSYDANGDIKSFKCIGESRVLSITDIYGTAAEWFEEEINELMGIEFEGLEVKNRLFLPDEFDGSGEIIVSSLSELKKNKE